MGVYRFDKKGEIYLETHHPGVTIEQIKENCGFDLNVSKVKGESPRPTYRDLFVLREFVDPELIFLPSKTDYTPAIQAIIDKG
jgi:glutaconate CoA-transferase subunit B